MTIEPTSWTDGYGAVHAWPPPDGYWIASDDRWYAPELHPDVEPELLTSLPDDTSSVDAAAWESAPEPSPPTNASSWESSHSWEPPPQRPEPEFPQPDAAADDVEPSAPSSRRVIGAVIGLVALLGLMASLYTLIERSDDSAEVAADAPPTSSPQPTGDTDLSGDSPTTTGAPAPSDPSSPADAPSANVGVVQPVSSSDDALASIESCSRIDAETIEITMVNQSEVTASYLLSVAYLDDEGTQVGEDNAYLSSLRPGERAIERSYVFSDAGVGCTVIAADRYDRDGNEDLGDISACTIREPNASGYVVADITATNSGATDVDYTVEVALIDADGIRRGSGTAYIERTAVGATAPGEVYTIVAHDPTYRCEVVAVTRFESAG